MAKMKKTTNGMNLLESFFFFKIYFFYRNLLFTGIYILHEIQASIQNITAKQTHVQTTSSA